MEIKITAMAGTLESSDVSVVVEPNEKSGLAIELMSDVEKQYGDQIKEVIIETLADLQVENAVVKVNDKGALDCVIKARLQAAVYRAAEEKQVNWEVK